MLKKTFTDRTLPFIIGLISIILRIYRIDVMPLWLDEIYSYQLGKLGLHTIFVNSLYDPHPPLWYLIHNVTTLFGTLANEVGMRWLTFVMGSITPPLLYIIVRRYTDPLPAALSALMLTFSPFHIYFSQEARSYAFDICLVILNSYFFLNIVEQEFKRIDWIKYAITLLIGLYSNYGFIFIAIIQIPYLFFISKLYRKTLTLSIILLIFCIPWLYIFNASIISRHIKKPPSITTSIFHFFQIISNGDTIRYGLTWGHSVTAVIFIGLIIFSLVKKPRHYYFHFQILGILGVFFGILRMNIAPSDVKLFIVLLPYMYILIGIALHIWLYKIGIPKIFIIIITACVIIINSIALQSYWIYGKGYQNSLAFSNLQREINFNQDIIISANYITDAHLSIYAPNIHPYTKPKITNNTILFSRSTIITLAQPEESEPLIPFENIIVGKRVWLFISNTTLPIYSTLFQQCTFQKGITYQGQPIPSTLVLFTDCRPLTSTSATPIQAIGVAGRPNPANPKFARSRGDF